MAQPTAPHRYPLADDRSSVEAAAKRAHGGPVVVLQRRLGRYGQPPTLPWAPAAAGRVLATTKGYALVEYAATEVLAGH